MRWTSALRHVIHDVTLGPVRARVILETRIDALHVDAGVLVRTVAVTVTSDGAAELDEEITDEAGTASALGHVVHDVALLMRSARRFQETGAHAVVVDASSVGTAVGVAATLDAVTAEFGVAVVA